MTEVYSTAERAIIFIVYFIASATISTVYLWCRVDWKRTSKVIFIAYIIYATAFVYLNLLAMLDLLFNGIEGFSKFSDVLSIYYEVFYWIDKAFGLVIFNILIYYFESGQYSICGKLLDWLIRTCKDLKKKKKLIGIAIRLAVVIPLFVVY